jgi:hypothetical protein
MDRAHNPLIISMLFHVCVTGCAAQVPHVTPPATNSQPPPIAHSATRPAAPLGPDGPVFGDSRNARRIVFCCDCSGSMINKMPVLKERLTKAVNSLDPTQSFEMIFFQDEKYDSFMKYFHRAEDLVPATPEAKKKAAEFLEGVTTTGSTDPLPGIRGAFKANPDLIYLLTDGDFPDNDAILKLTRDLNSDRNPKVRINTIAFVGDGDSDVVFFALLKTIAKESGGTFRLVKESELN